jgi:endonuclease YncB( thermonuclease family)
MNKLIVVVAMLFCGNALCDEPITVERVIDGDTVSVVMNTKVRLWLVDTPETKTVRKQGQKVLPEFYGQEAKQFTSDWMQSHENLTVEIKTIDSYGRLVVLVKSGDDCLNKDLVANGFARVRPEYARSRRQKEILVPYLNAEKDAKAKKIGIWSNVP